MLAKPVKVELPRRVVVLYLLYSLLAITWLTVSALFVAKSIVVRSGEDELLSYLEHATAVATVELISHDNAPHQPLVERFSREHSLLFCAFVSSDNTYVAHSHQGRLGQTHRSEDGISARHGNIESVRYTSGSLRIRAYSSPIRINDESALKLVIAKAEPTIFEIFQMASRHAFVVLCGPLLLVFVGGFTLHRLVRPMAAVDAQLRGAAMAPTLADMDLAPIKSRSPSVLSWNRIVRAFEEENPRNGLDQRVSDAVQSLRQGKSDDVLNSLIDGVAVSDQEGSVTFANQALAATATHASCTRSQLE